MNAELQRSFEHMQHLLARDIPPVLLAHYLMRVLVPRIAMQIGFDDCIKELQGMFSYHMAEAFGVCTCCLKTKATTDDGHCQKCDDELVQFEASIQ